ncbi:hypothetical protein [Clostridium sp.]|uniref:hypothetical protein n=1 Tax=Clostridium sp. TaxID=1506 RepID=UPI00257A247F|nr:hypothetical protein [Clostridium sp.]
MGMNDKHDYEPTKWVDNSEPDIDAEHLNKIESALQEYGASIDELAATGGTAAKVKATDTYGLVVDALGESTAQALIDAIANKVVNELINKNKIVNNLLATDASTVLAGTQGAALDKRLVAAENAVTQLNSDLFQYQNNNVKIRFVSDSNGDVGIVLTHGVNNRNAIIKLADNNFRIDYTNASGVWNNAVTWELK